MAGIDTLIEQLGIQIGQLTVDKTTLVIELAAARGEIAALTARVAELEGASPEGADA